MEIRIAHLGRRLPIRFPPGNDCLQYIHDMLGVPGNVSNRPDSRPYSFAYPARPQKSEFQIFRFSVSDRACLMPSPPCCWSRPRRDMGAPLQPGVIRSRAFPAWASRCPRRPRPPPRGDCGGNSGKARSPGGRNSLCTFKNAEVTAPIQVLLDRVSSVLAQSGRPSSKESRKTLKVLQHICFIIDCICDC